MAKSRLVPVVVTSDHNQLAAPGAHALLPRATAALARLGLLPLKTLTRPPLSLRNWGTYPGYGTSREGPWDLPSSSVRGESGIAVLVSNHQDGGRLRRLIHSNELTGLYRRRCRLDGVWMAKNTAQERPEQTTQEQVDLERQAFLLEVCGDDDELRRRLALAWQLGFTRALRLAHSHSPSLTINPFWK